MLTAEPNYIIAIGASAGGMEEINSFFDHTPLDGVAYIIVQHLSPDFKSRMVELLSKHSKLEVKEAVNDTVVKANCVYLIPNNKYMTISDNKLSLTDKKNDRAPHLTINRLFESLAYNSGSKAIAVVLSGLGADGTEGIKAIKRAGGMVIVRNPHTSEFNSMPSQAIATGLADFIIEPEQMPEAIEEFIKNREELMTDHAEDDKTIETIIDLIKEKSPLDFSEYKHATILRRTKRRAIQTNFSSLADYYEFLKNSPEELETLSKDFLISVTAFFRDWEAFDLIRNNVLPLIVDKLVAGEELKLWVAGCATGEEVYSLAILVAEQLIESGKENIVKIFATDIDSIALAHAGKGVYSPAVVKQVPEVLLGKYFIAEGINYRIKPVIRKMVIFANHDLIKNPPYCNMHFISCRNLLIYMTPVLQKKIYALLLFGLKTDGYLFLGSSESPIPILQNLEVVDKKWKIYKNIKSKRAVNFEAFTLPDFQDTKRPPSRLVLDSGVKATNNALADAVIENMVNESGGLVVCVNENNQAIKTFGNTGKYLLQKNFNSNLAELLPKPLAVAFNTLTNSVLKTKEKVSVNGIQVPGGHQLLSVNLSVAPLDLNYGDQKLLMVTFNESREAMRILPEDVVFDEKIYMDQYTLNLEDEVKDLKIKLYSTYEQLDASNENMQSFNEELLSANEEMQSTNEEMQSVNEELDTINSEYQSKNKELSAINDDLNNYFRSNINGQLFIDNDLLLMKFSPGTVNLINLLDTDIGRPISNISTNIKLETILTDIKQVLAEGTVVTKEIETNDGKWYLCMTMPYIQQANNQQSGAIVTFNDITALKQAQQELDQKNKSLIRINTDLDHFIHAASHDLLAPLSNIETSINIMNKISLSEPKLIDFLNIINDSIKKFSLLVKDIATIAKVESDMNITESIDLEDIIDNIEWSLENKIKASGAVIKRELNVKKLIFSKKNLRSIVYNLISNAIKFKGLENPVVTISTVKEGGYFVLTVHDNGIGISPANVAKIFDMYGRLNNDVEGQGIGLYLAKKIINAANGTIVVESEPGKGSKFIIYFKISVAEPLLIA
jgi:two-component system CheB/CheR fusion protein